MALQAGDQIGQYQIQEQPAVGGMATVYRAYHPKLDRYVAIKMMHPQLLADESFHARFEREARVVAKLDHTNIVPVYDYSEFERQPYLVMKYIEGQTLKGVLRKGAIPLAEIRRVMHALAGALDYAHKQGILHRDLKPSNIIIAEDGTPYITDFGLARIAQAGESTMSADMMLGTPQYISPEQARGDKNIDFHTDLYSLGIILYELIVGRVPFSADTAYATVHEQIYEPPPRPSDINSEITPQVEAVLLKAIAKEPTERYASAKALIQALEDALDHSGLRTLDPSRVEKAVPVQHTPSPIPPAVKEKDTGVLPVVLPPQPQSPPDLRGMFGQVVGKTLNVVDRALDEALETGSESRRTGKEMRRDIRKAQQSGNWQRTTWRQGTQWHMRGPEGPGFYRPDELEVTAANLSDDDRIRKHIEKRMEERTGLIIHSGIYFALNIMFWVIWLSISISEGAVGFPWPLTITLPWGIGVFSHYMSYYNKYGAGRDRREAMIQAEIERERSRTMSTKAKNDDYYDPALRLTEEGELTDSYVEE
ncbi:MAG: protein kinase, partial [Anaerolineae bacterium]|nr:protein kinase [Anaerolineae bacterium]